MNRPSLGSGDGSANTSGTHAPALPADAEHRLALSRALIVQAMQQPNWLLLAQRVCASAAPSDQDRRQAQQGLLDICLQSLLSTWQGLGPGPTRSTKPPDAARASHSPHTPPPPATPVRGRPEGDKAECEPPERHRP